jgi:hypothetical protein
MGQSVKRSLERRARQLAKRFVDDVQVLFDDDGMIDEIYDGDVMQALAVAQAYAEDLAEAGK